MSLDIKQTQCEECTKMFDQWKYGSEHRCVTCRAMRAMERIAEAIERWVGWQ
jgi:hypothetical protein